MQNKNDLHGIKIVPLGGVEEIGINSTAIEYNNEIVVIDCGMGFPENDQYGVDFLIPNTFYLKKNIRKLKAIFITHAHYDHIGALDILLPKLNYPKVYAPRFALELIKSRLTESRILDKCSLNLYTERDSITIGGFQFEFFKVNHSTPDSFGISINTRAGRIVHTGDFKFDNNPIGEKHADYNKIAKIGAQGVLALMSDSTNSFKPGFSKSESEVAGILRSVVEKAEGRIIVATFSQLVLRINQLLEAAESLGKKVAISGKSLEKTIEIAKKIGYIKIPNDLIVPLNKIKNFPLEKQIILTTGHQGETMAALSRIARGEHKDIKIQKGDTVILSSSVIPGNDVLVQKMIDELYMLGARVFHQGIMDLHAGGHGYQEDQKLMLNLINPKYFIPVHGYQSFLMEHARTAESLGINKQNTLIPRRGEEIIVSKNSIRRGIKYKSTPVIVSGLGVGDIGAKVLSERGQLANFGIVIIVFDINYKTKALNNKTQIITKGFVYEKNLQNLLRGISNVADDTIKQLLKENFKYNGIKEKIESVISKYIYKEIEREPMIQIIFS